MLLYTIKRICGLCMYLVYLFKLNKIQVQVQVQLLGKTFKPLKFQVVFSAQPWSSLSHKMSRP